jgi:hypothetical protein
MVSNVVALPASLVTLLSVALSQLCDVELVYQTVNVMRLVTAQRNVLQTMIVPVVKFVPREIAEQSVVDQIHVHR